MSPLGTWLCSTECSSRGAAAWCSRGRKPNGTHFVSGTALAAGNSPENVDLELPVASAKPLKVSAIGRFAVGCACLSLVLLTGCFELETRIQYNTNGSATITERLNFSQRLLDLGRVPGSETPIVDLLLRPAVEARMKLMGQGIRLASHETRDGAHGSRESIAVFEIADANEFHYASPFLAYTDYPENNIVKMDVVPMLKSGNYAGMAGDMKVGRTPA